MASVIPFGSDRFRLRLTLDNPLPMVGEGRSPRPFDHYLAELVRDADERVCAFIDVYFLRLGAVRGSYMRAAVALGSKHLARVCLDALDDEGRVLEYIEDSFGDAMTDVYVLDDMNIVEPDADRPVLQGMFVQELSSALSRGLDVFFINAPDVELDFWRPSSSTAAPRARSTRRIELMLAAGGDAQATALTCPRKPVSCDRLRVNARAPAGTRGDGRGAAGQRAMDASQPAGQRPRPRVRRLYGALRGNAIPLRGTDRDRIWFDFRTRRIKVPYTRVLSPPAGDVDSNGNVVYMVDFGRYGSNSRDRVS